MIVSPSRVREAVQTLAPGMRVSASFVAALDERVRDLIRLAVERQTAPGRVSRRTIREDVWRGVPPPKGR